MRLFKIRRARHCYISPLRLHLHPSYPCFKASLRSRRDYIARLHPTQNLCHWARECAASIPEGEEVSKTLCKGPGRVQYKFTKGLSCRRQPPPPCIGARAPSTKGSRRLETSLKTGDETQIILERDRNQFGQCSGWFGHGFICDKALLKRRRGAAVKLV